MDENNKNYDALRNMFLQPPMYLPSMGHLGQSALDAGHLVPGLLPGHSNPTGLMFGHPFAPTGAIPMLPYRDFPYLPFPTAAAAMDGSSHIGHSLPEGSNLWTGLYPFVADPFLAEAMKMNLTPYLAGAADGGSNKSDSKKSATGKEGKKSSTTSPPKQHHQEAFPKVDTKKRSSERSASSHSEGSNSSHDRHTPGTKSPAISTAPRPAISPGRRDHNILHQIPPPPLMKTPPSAHERKRSHVPDTSSCEEALDYSKSAKIAKSPQKLQTLLLKPEKEKIERVKHDRGAPKFGDVEWLSNPDSSPKVSSDRRKTETSFMDDPVVRGEALQVRIAQYNVSQLRSRGDMNVDNSWTARIEPDYSDLGYSSSRDMKDSKSHGDILTKALKRSSKPDDRRKSMSPSTSSAFEKVDKKQGHTTRDSVIVSRSTESPKRFTLNDRMSDMIRDVLNASDDKTSKDLENDLRQSLAVTSKRPSVSEPSVRKKHGKSSLSTSTEGANHVSTKQERVPEINGSIEKSLKSRNEHTSKQSSEEKLPKSMTGFTVKESMHSILDNILHDCHSSERATNSRHDDGDKAKGENLVKKSDSVSVRSELVSSSPAFTDTDDVSTRSRSPRTSDFSGRKFSSFLPLSEVLSSAINSEFARSCQSPASDSNSAPTKSSSKRRDKSTSNIPDFPSDNMRLFSQSSICENNSQGADEASNACMSIENIIDRLERDDDDAKDADPPFPTKTCDNNVENGDKPPDKESQLVSQGCSKTIDSGSKPNVLSSKNAESEVEAGEIGRSTDVHKVDSGSDNNQNRKVEGDPTVSSGKSSSTDVFDSHSSAHVLDCKHGDGCISGHDSIPHTETLSSVGSNIDDHNLANSCRSDISPTDNATDKPDSLGKCFVLLKDIGVKDVENDGSTRSEIPSSSPVNVDGTEQEDAVGDLGLDVGPGNDPSTKLVLVKDPKNGYAVKPSRRELDRDPLLTPNIITPDIVERVIQAVVLAEDVKTSNGSSRVAQTTSTENGFGSSKLARETRDSLKGSVDHVNDQLAS